MSAITEQQLSDLIEQAFDDESDVTVTPDEARRRQAQKIANAIALFVQGRQTVGTSSDGATVTTTIQ